MTLSDAWIDFVAGWCSGAAAVVVCQPVDTVLTRYQAGIMMPNIGTRSFLQNAGLTALWRGASPMITAVPLQNMMLMGGYGLGQRYAALYNPEQKLMACFVGGCTGGVLQSFLMSPVELIKVSQQCAGQSLSSAARKVVTNLNHSASWRGLDATLLRDGIPHGVWFAAYEVAKDDLNVRLSNDPVAVPLLSGALAATAAWGVGYPADLIKTRIQASGSMSLGIYGTAQLLIKEADGQILAGLYRGFGLKLVRSIPASMIGFTVYEFVKKHIESL